MKGKDSFLFLLRSELFENSPKEPIEIPMFLNYTVHTINTCFVLGKVFFCKRLAETSQCMWRAFYIFANISSMGKEEGSFTIP
jgi:hypothetical protein